MCDISLLSYICPVCKCARFGPHWMKEYEHEWNKCSTCGYMEKQEITRLRIMSKLYPDRLTKPFKDPIPLDIAQKRTYMTIYSEHVDQDDDASSDADQPTTD